MIVSDKSWIIKMQVLWKKEIEDIKNSGYLTGDLSITDALIENFYNEILTLGEKELLKLAFCKNPTQEELNELLKDWDIEVKGGSKSLMLAYFIKRHSELKFTSYEEPRLKGLLNYYRFHNLKTVAHFTKVGKALNKEGIVPIILKGGAMKFLRPDLPRVMGDIDILVPSDKYMRSAEIAAGLGYWWKKVDIHSIDLHPEGTEEGAIDLHKFIYMNTGFEENLLKGLFKRAEEKLVFGVKALVPSFEDMMFISLVNLARNLRDKTSQAGLLYALFDCKFLIENKPEFNWDIVKEDAKLTKTQVQVNFAVKFIEKISPNILPEEITDKKLFEKETRYYSNMVMYDRFYLEDLRIKCRALPIRDIFKSKENFLNYLKMKPKYYILKMLRKHPLLIEFFIRDLKTKKYDFEN